MAYTTIKKRSKAWWFWPIAVIVLILISVSITLIKVGEFGMQSAHLVILTLTLIALIFYAADTHFIALLDKSRWERENICKAFYYMEMSDHYQREGIFSILSECDGFQ